MYDSIEALIAWCIEKGVKHTEVGQITKVWEDSDGEKETRDQRLTKLAKKFNHRNNTTYTGQELAQRLAQATSVNQNHDFGKLEKNMQRGPLSLPQKVYIRDHLDHLPAKDIAFYINTSYQAVRTAQQGGFNEPPETPRSTRPYGPLSYQEQCDIRDNKQEHRTADLAREYNTGRHNIDNAKSGRFSEPPQQTQANRNRGKWGPLTLEQKIHIRDNLNDVRASTLAHEYQTSAANIRIAQRGDFKDPSEAQRPAYERLESLLTLMGKGHMLITNDGNKNLPLDDIFKELLA